MSDSASRGRPAKETPTQRVARLAAEAAERRKRVAAKCTRESTEPQGSVNKAEDRPLPEEPPMPSPVRTGRAAGKEPLIDLEGHYLPINKSREEPCSKMRGRRPRWFLDYVRAATPTAEMLSKVPPVVAESSHVPIRGWTRKMELVTNDMGPAEQIQFGNALLSRLWGRTLRRMGNFRIRPRSTRRRWPSCRNLGRHTISALLSNNPWTMK